MTPIAYERSGSGPPLILVHGTGADRSIWRPVLGRLRERCTVVNVDRRGRNGSGDNGAAYSLAGEAEDLAAMAEALGGPVAVLGHSFGAIVALEAGLLTPAIARLALYEPPFPTDVEVHRRDTVGRVEELLAAGDREGVVTTFCRDIGRMSERQVEALRRARGWLERLAAAHTIPREMRAAQGYRLDPQRFAGFATPTLLLLGSESGPYLKASTEAVHAALPQSSLTVLLGHGHRAMHTAPELLAREVRPFLLG